MAGMRKPPSAPQKPPGRPHVFGAAEESAEQSERDALLRGITDLENENRTLEGRIAECGPEKVAELKKLNDELKATLNKTEKALKSLMVELKLPKDAMGFADQIFVLKTALIAYCVQNDIDPALWKNLEYL